MLHRRFVAVFAAVAAAAVAGVGLVVPAQAATTAVPDAGFAACLNTNYLGQAAGAPITVAQLAGLSGVVECVSDGIVSIEGAENLTGLTDLYLTENSISDLAPLSGLTGLESLWIERNGISDLGPLSGLTGLVGLGIDGNQVSDLGPLSGLTGLTFLYLSATGISDLGPLSGLTGLLQLNIAGNKITDLAPLSGLAGLVWLDISGNRVSDLSPLSGLTGLTDLDLHNNLVTDLTPISFMTWGESPYSGGLAVWASDQTASMTVTVGQSALLPVIPVAAVSPVTWTVTSGTATVSSDGTTVTMSAPGTATLTWAGANPYSMITDLVLDPTDIPFTGTLTVTAVVPPVLVSSVTVSPASAAVLVGATTAVKATVAPANAANPAVTWSSSDTSIATVDSNGVVTGVKAGTATITATAVDGSGKSGTATVTVTAPAPVPSVPGSTVAKSGLKASTTGGAARLADGKDAYTVTVSVVDMAGHPLPGVASQLAASSAKGVTVSKITDNGDGTYSLTVSSATPGNYLVTVTLNGAVVGSPVPVNFIGATDPPTQQVGATQTATGLGFLPGEKVTVTVHSTPLSLGVFTADSAGTVQVSFPVPAAFADASHTVVFAGVTSGTVSASFAVPAQTLVPAGGTPVPGSPAAGFVFASFLTLAGGVLVRRLRTAR